MESFSTFDVVAITGINRNTLQSALAGGFIEPDIKRADGPSERNQFSREGIYSVSLFFNLVRCNWPRRKAKHEVEKLSWQNIGQGKDQFKYLIYKEMDPGSANLRSFGRWELEKNLPQD